MTNFTEILSNLYSFRLKEVSDSCHMTESNYVIYGSEYIHYGSASNTDKWSRKETYCDVVRENDIEISGNKIVFGCGNNTSIKKSLQ